MKLFRAKPVTVEAIRWTGENRDEWYQFWGIRDIGNPISWPPGSWAVRTGSTIHVVRDDAAFHAAYESVL